jgi:hypothetical protein
MAYIPRVVDAEVRDGLQTLGAVLIEGPRACGKTVTGLHHAASDVRLDALPDAVDLVRLAPQQILAGTTPRLVDEWQLAPALWNLVRHEVDARGRPGQFILTGSATPADDISRHSGAGRVLRVRMRPMSLWELGQSSGQVSLAALLTGEPAPGSTAALGFADLVQSLCIGGWPGLRNLTPQRAMAATRSYLEDVARVDLPAATGSRRDPVRVERLLRALARHSSSPVPATTLARDVGTDDEPMKSQTVASYLDALTRVHVLEDQETWSAELRSRARLRLTAKRHFVDPSLAVAALRASPDRLVHDLSTLGLLFESLVVRDLRVYAQAVGGRVLHFRDGSGAEADAIIELSDGRWAAVEVKLSGARVEEAATSLHRVTARVDTPRLGAPAALIVITADRFGYQREDGVAVVPISALAP